MSHVVYTSASTSGWFLTPNPVPAPGPKQRVGRRTLLEPIQPEGLVRDRAGCYDSLATQYVVSNDSGCINMNMQVLDCGRALLVLPPYAGKHVLIDDDVYSAPKFVGHKPQRSIRSMPTQQSACMNYVRHVRNSRRPVGLGNTLHRALCAAQHALTQKRRERHQHKKKEGQPAAGNGDLVVPLFFWSAFTSTSPRSGMTGAGPLCNSVIIHYRLESSRTKNPSSFRRERDQHAHRRTDSARSATWPAMR